MMTKRILVILLMATMTTFAADIEFRAPVLIPPPREMTYESGVAVRIEKGTRFEVTCPDPSAAAWVKEHATQWFGVTPEVTQTATAADGVDHDEGYTLDAAPGRIALGAKAFRGVKYAMHTLRQAAERESVGRTLRGYWLPALKIKDAPALSFRGVHFCWFPECTTAFIEHQFRLAAYYKFNYVVLESWGVFKGTRHPYLAIKDAPLTVAEAGRLAALAKDLGVTLVPQINIFGHASFARGMGGKHVTLDFHPEMQPLFEPAGGWNWCLSNPEARAVLREHIAEMHDAFGRPPFFHIGCDEADEPSCPRCRAVKPYATLVEAHIKEVAEMFRARGTRVMMWHDMLLEKAGGKWKPFYANGSADEAKMLETLPKDIVICDWYYGSDGGGHDPTGGKVVTGAYPTLDYFISKGFSTLTCPWRVTTGIVAQGRYAREKKLFGTLQTVWHHFRGREFANMMQQAATAAWGDRPLAVGGWSPPFMVHWRQVGWDEGITDLREAGVYDTTVTRDGLDL